MSVIFPFFIQVYPFHELVWPGSWIEVIVRNEPSAGVFVYFDCIMVQKRV